MAPSIIKTTQLPDSIAKQVNHTPEIELCTRQRIIKLFKTLAEPTLEAAFTIAAIKRPEPSRKLRKLPQIAISLVI